MARFWSAATNQRSPVNRREIGKCDAPSLYLGPQPSLMLGEHRRSVTVSTNDERIAPLGRPHDHHGIGRNELAFREVVEDWHSVSPTDRPSRFPAALIG
jgi:hypothetical protein